MMIEITRTSFNRAKFTGKSKETKHIKRLLKIWVDGAQYSPKYNETDKYGRRRWDGYFRFYNSDNEFDWGIVDEIMYHLKSKKINFTVHDDSGIKFIKKIKTRDTLRPHQNRAVKKFFKNNLGITIVPTRGGKTYIASEKIRLAMKNDENLVSLFLVDTIDLFNQTLEEFSGYFGIEQSEIGTINDKGVNIKQINVCMIQSLVSKMYPAKRKTDTREKIRERNRTTRQMRKFLHSVNFLIVDEIQEYSSSKRMNCLKACKNVTFLSGLSATPFKDEDEDTTKNVIQNLKIKAFFGGIVYSVPISELQEQGYLALDKAILFSYNHEYYKIDNRVNEDDGYHSLLTQLIHENKERNKILIDFIRLCRKNKWKTLVLFNSKKHGRIISRKTAQPFICGDDKSDVRKAAKDKFLSGKGKILLASNIYKKGITLPEAEILVFGDGGLEGSNVTQKKGRVLGAVDGKTRAIIADIMDIEDKYFSNHSYNRLRVYDEEIGQDRIEIHEPTDMKDVEDSIKEWLDEKKGI